MLAAGLPAAGVRAQSPAGKAWKGSAAANPATQDNSGSAGAAAFIKADTFQETRAGYAFKAGPQGTGYYPDK